MTKAITILTAAGALALAGCGDDDSSDTAGGSDATTTEAAQTAAPPEPKATGTEIAVAGSDYGPVLFDGDDQAIYIFDRESGPTSECYGECAAAWPPVLTKGDPQASGDVEQGLLGTTKRNDGTTQVTYRGQPLYYYAHEGPGAVTCHDVEEFGGLWLAVDPSGRAA